MQSYEYYYIVIISKNQIDSVIVEVHENELDRSVFSWWDNNKNAITLTK